MSNDKVFKFCPFCGSKLKMAYPGAGRKPDGSWDEGDPENGPANLRCLKDSTHGGPCDLLDEEVMDKAHEIEADFLERLREGYRDDPYDPPVWPEVMFAAKVIEAFEYMKGVHWGRLMYQMGGGEEGDGYTRMQVYKHLIRRK